MKKQEKMIFSGLRGLARELEKEEWAGARFVIMTDENVLQHCLPPLIGSVEAWQETDFIEVPVGEECKSIEVAAQVWETMVESGYDRQTVLVALGGGCVTDLGGFVASGYMRGIRRINIPTSLIGMADAAIGGKTAINLGGLKNVVGSFCPADLTVIEPAFLDTLAADELRAGKMEMVKTAAVANPDLYGALLADDRILKQQVTEVAKMKQAVVKADPCDHGIRHILNFGHTFGHAIETLSHQKGRPMSHGLAVGAGMLVAMYLSAKKTGLDPDVYNTYSAWVRRQMEVPFVGLKDIEAMLAAMRHDKKNADGEVRCVLLRALGEAVVDVAVSDNEVRDAFLSACK